MVVIILLVTRFVARLVTLFFRAIQEGRMDVGWLYPETAVPTRKLVVLAVWLFGAAFAYPYVPGSDSDAFKGISLLTGLMLSLGSSGIVGQVMGGFTLTYSRALRRGGPPSRGAPSVLPMRLSHMPPVTSTPATFCANRARS